MHTERVEPPLITGSRRKYPFVFLDSVILYFSETEEDPLIHGIVTLDGRLDFPRLKRAVRLSLDAEPILGCRLVYHPLFPWWEPREDLDIMESCRLMQLQVGERREALDAFLAAPLDPFRDPLVQAAVLREGDDMLVFKIHHTAMDAGGVREYLSLIGDLYNRLKDNPEFKPTPNINGSRSLRQVSSQFSTADKIRILRRSLRDLRCDGLYLLDKICGRLDKKRKDSTPEEGWGLPLKHGGSRDRAYVLHTLPAHLVQSLKGYARSHGATLNDAILAAFYRAIRREFAPHPDKSMDILTSVDLRRYLPKNRGEALCNLSGNLHLNIGYNPGAGFLETMGRVRDRMLSHKADLIGLGDFPLSIAFKFIPFCLKRKLAQYDRASRLRENLRPMPKISNTGNIPAGLLRLDELTIRDLRLIGPIAYAPEFVVGVGGFNGSITLSAGITNAAENAPILKRLFEAMQNEIRTACVNAEQEGSQSPDSFRETHFNFRLPDPGSQA